MKLSEGVRGYVSWKHANGYRFERGENTLLAFSRMLGEVRLSEVEAEHILTFLNRRSVSTITWRLRYWILYRFFEHWSNRGAMPSLTMPTPRPFVRQAFVPYIFTTAELRSLLEATAGKNARLQLDGQTLRAIILFLYATGASVGEVALILRSDVHLEEGVVKIRSTRANRSRGLPIGPDLLEVLNGYTHRRSEMVHQSPYLFVTKNGLPISINRIAKHFRRLRKVAGVYRRDGSSHQPRVDDLRYSFAVHRITKWIEDGADLNRMLPALAAYMGQVGLGSTERYIFMTPERFRKDLNKLSPTHEKGKWRSDHDLMRFLTGL